MPDGSESIGVVAALPEELRPLLTRLERRRRVGAARTWRGYIGGRELLLTACGDGWTRAADGLAVLLERESPRALLLVGIAGGLSPELVPGDRVAAAEVWTTGGDRLRSPAAAPWPLPEHERGVLCTSRQIAVTPRAKEELWESLGRPPRAAVDTETAAWAGVAADHGIPWLAVRVVSDTAGERLPLDFNRLVGPDGAVRRARVVWRALLSPWSIPGLLRLRRRLRRGAVRVADAVERLVGA